MITNTGTTSAADLTKLVKEAVESSSPSYWWGVGQNLVASALFVLLLVVLFYLLRGLGSRAKLLPLFARGNTPDEQITIFHSVIHTGSGDPFISAAETKNAQGLVRLFNNPIPILAEDNWFGERIQIIGTTCRLSYSSNANDEELFQQNCIVVGSPAFNPVAEAYERILCPPFECSHRPTNEPLFYSLKTRANTELGQQTAIIVRMTNASGAVCFYAAGPTAATTAGAIHFLKSKWRQLAEWRDDYLATKDAWSENPSGDFFCVLKVPNSKPELAEFSEGPHSLTRQLETTLTKASRKDPRPANYWEPFRKADFAAYAHPLPAKESKSPSYFTLNANTEPAGSYGTLIKAAQPPANATMISGAKDPFK